MNSGSRTRAPNRLGTMICEMSTPDPLTEAEIEAIAGAGEKPPSSGRVETAPSNGRISLVADASAPRPDLAGYRLVRPGHPEIYLVDPDGYRRRVPNHTTYNRLFRSWSGITNEACLADVALRPQFTTGTVLVRGDASSRIYLLDEGLKRLITDDTVMEKYWFNWAGLFVVKQALLDRIRPGVDWK
jgi:hypothetical protein